ncbi:MAG: division/cell wall cluster transcriptional repressor MraZ [Desulfovibrio sp.]|nr:division/cell wall cluster transcriptional repressor MraZ [Desulfovibrio sp.]
MRRLFVSPHARSLDVKGRLMLPPEYRESLEKARGDEGGCAFWLTAFYGRLVAYLPAQWEQISEQLARVPVFSVKLSHFKSKVLGLAQYLSPDAQGRIRIPQPLMREVGIEKDVMLVGMGDKFEIWDQRRFDELQVDDISGELEKTGLQISL